MQSRVSQKVAIRPGKQVAAQFVYRNPVRRYGRYLVFAPLAYDGKKAFPTIFFLHGSGERGNNLELLKRHGLPKIVEDQSDFPFIVISPQCPQRHLWSVTFLEALFESVIANLCVDRQRIYLTGLSIGGFATWKWALAHPRHFAAVAPICGGSNPQEAYKIAHLPVWAFHGAQDKVVPVEKTLEMVSALEKAGGKPKVTIYLDAGHDAWTQTYQNPQLYRWFLKHQNCSLIAESANV